MTRIANRKVSFWVAGYYDDFNSARAIPDDTNNAVPTSGYEGFESTHQGNPMNGNAPLNPRYRYSWTERKAVWSASFNSTDGGGGTSAGAVVGPLWGSASAFNNFLSYGNDTIPEIWPKRYAHNGGIHEYLTYDKHAIGKENNGLIGYSGRFQLEYPCTLVGNRWIYGGITSYYNSPQSYTLFCNGYDTSGEYWVWNGNTDATHGRQPIDWVTGSVVNIDTSLQTNDRYTATANTDFTSWNGNIPVNPTLHHYGYLTGFFQMYNHSKAGILDQAHDRRLDWSHHDHTPAIRSPGGKPFWAMSTFHAKTNVQNGETMQTCFEMLYDGALNPMKIDREDYFGIRMASINILGGGSEKAAPVYNLPNGVNYTLEAGFGSTDYPSDSGFKKANGSAATGMIKWVFNPKTGVGCNPAWKTSPIEWDGGATQWSDELGGLGNDASNQAAMKHIWKDIDIQMDWTNLTYRVFVDGLEVSDNPLMAPGNTTSPYSFEATTTASKEDFNGWQLKHTMVEQGATSGGAGVALNNPVWIHTLIDRVYCGKDLSNPIPSPTATDRTLNGELIPGGDQPYTLTNMNLQMPANSISQLSIQIEDEDNQSQVNRLIYALDNQVNDYELLLFRDQVDRPLWRGNIDKITTLQSSSNQNKTIKINAKDSLAEMNRQVPMWEIGQSSLTAMEVTDFREKEIEQLYDRLYTGTKALELHSHKLSGDYNSTPSLSFKPLKSQRTMLHAGHPIQMYCEEDLEGPSEVHRYFEGYPVVGISHHRHTIDAGGPTGSTSVTARLDTTKQDEMRLYFPRENGQPNEFVASLSPGDVIQCNNLPTTTLTGASQGAVVGGNLEVLETGQQGGVNGSYAQNTAAGRLTGATDINITDEDRAVAVSGTAESLFFDWVAVRAPGGSGVDAMVTDFNIVSAHKGTMASHHWPYELNSEATQGRKNYEWAGYGTLEITVPGLIRQEYGCDIGRGSLVCITDMNGGEHLFRDFKFDAADNRQTVPGYVSEYFNSTDPAYEHTSHGNGPSPYNTGTVYSKWAPHSYEGMHKVLSVLEIDQATVDARIAGGYSVGQSQLRYGSAYTIISLATAWKGLPRNNFSTRGSYGNNPVDYPFTSSTDQENGDSINGLTQRLRLSLATGNATKAGRKIKSHEARNIHARWMQDIVKSPQIKKLFAPIEETPIIEFKVPHQIDSTTGSIRWEPGTGLPDDPANYSHDGASWLSLAAFVYATKQGTGSNLDYGIDQNYDGAVIEFWDSTETTLLDVAYTDGYYKKVGSANTDQPGAVDSIWVCNIVKVNLSKNSGADLLYDLDSNSGTPYSTANSWRTAGFHETDTWPSRACLALGSAVDLDGEWVYMGAHPSAKSADGVWSPLADRNGFNAEGLAYDGVWQLERVSLANFPKHPSKDMTGWTDLEFSEHRKNTAQPSFIRKTLGDNSNGAFFYWLKDGNGKYLDIRERGEFGNNPPAQLETYSHGSITQTLSKLGGVHYSAANVNSGSANKTIIGRLKGITGVIPAGAIAKVRRYRDEYKHLYVLWADMRNDGTADADGGTKKNDFGLLYPTADNYNISLTYVDQETVDGSLEKYISFAVGNDCDIWSFNASQEHMRKLNGESNKSYAALEGGSNTEDNSMYHNWEDKAGAFIIIDFSKFFNLNTYANGGSTGRKSGGKKTIEDAETTSEGNPILIDNYWVQAIPNSLTNAKGHIPRHPKEKYFISDVQLVVEDISIYDDEIKLADVSKYPYVGVGYMTATEGDNIEKAIVGWWGKDITNNKLLNIYTLDYYNIMSALNSGAYAVWLDMGMSNYDFVEYAMITGAKNSYQANQVPGGTQAPTNGAHSNWTLAVEEMVTPGIAWEKIEMTSNITKRIPLRLMLNMEGFVESRNLGTYWFSDKFRFIWGLALTKYWAEQTILPAMFDINNVPISNNLLTDIAPAPAYFKSDDFGSTADIRGKTIYGAIQSWIGEASNTGKNTGEFMNWQFYIGQDGRVCFRPPYNTGVVLNRDIINISRMNNDISGMISAVRVFYRGGKSFVDYPKQTLGAKTKWKVLSKPEIVSGTEALAMAKAEYAVSRKSAKSLTVEYFPDLYQKNKMFDGARYGYILDPAIHCVSREHEESLSTGAITGNGKSTEWFWGGGANNIARMGMMNGLDGNMTGFADGYDGEAYAEHPDSGKKLWASWADGSGSPPVGGSREHTSGASTLPNPNQGGAPPGAAPHADWYATYDGSRDSRIDSSPRNQINWADYYYWYGSQSLSKAVQLVSVPRWFPKASTSAGQNGSIIPNQLRMAIQLTPGQTHGDPDQCTFDIILSDPDFDDNNLGSSTFTSSMRDGANSCTVTTVRANGMWECYVPLSYVQYSDPPVSFVATLTFSVNIDYLRDLVRYRCYNSTAANWCRNAHSSQIMGDASQSALLTDTAYNPNSLFPLGIRNYPEHGLSSAVDYPLTTALGAEYTGPNTGQGLYFAPRINIVDDINFRPGGIVHITDDRLGLSNDKWIVQKVDWKIDQRNTESVILTLQEDKSKLSGDMYGFIYPRLSHGVQNVGPVGSKESWDDRPGGGGWGGGSNDAGSGKPGNTDEKEETPDDGSADTDYGEDKGRPGTGNGKPGSPPLTADDAKDGLDKTPGMEGASYSGKKIGISQLEKGLISRINDRMKATGGTDILTGAQTQDILGKNPSKSGNQAQQVSSTLTIVSKAIPTSGSCTMSAEGISLPGHNEFGGGEPTSPSLQQCEIQTAIPAGATSNQFSLDAVISLGSSSPTDGSVAVLMMEVEVIETGDSFSKSFVLGGTQQQAGSASNNNEDNPNDITVLKGGRPFMRKPVRNDVLDAQWKMEKANFALLENARLDGAGIAGNTMKITLSRVADGVSDTAIDDAVVIHDLNLSFVGTATRSATANDSFTSHPTRTDKKSINRKKIGF